MKKKIKAIHKQIINMIKHRDRLGQEIKEHHLLNLQYQLELKNIYQKMLYGEEEKLFLQKIIKFIFKGIITTRASYGSLNLYGKFKKTFKTKCSQNTWTSQAENILFRCPNLVMRRNKSSRSKKNLN
jgi:exopolyphosphatase/pppGpp-phosphohydrolase